jgi:8-oxo-dGTP pyrophosphatase MutT (NUDIX family)
MRNTLHKTFGYSLLVLGLLSCGTGRTKDDSEPVSQSAPNKKPTRKPTALHATPRVLSEIELRALGLKIPDPQNVGDQTPPQAGALIQPTAKKPGVSPVQVKLKGHDLPWTATTLLLFRDEGTGEWEILSQKRAAHMTAPGTIETAGGHLTSGLTWRQGAMDEVNQETGIDPALLKASDFIGVGFKAPQITNRGKLMGHMNFVVVFTGTKPETHGKNCPEIDHAYGNEGHIWHKLGDEKSGVYMEILQEQRSQRAFKSGIYYSNFRGHLLAFGKEFQGWPDR